MRAIRKGAAARSDRRRRGGIRFRRRRGRAPDHTAVAAVAGLTATARRTSSRYSRSPSRTACA